jgi:hypothetical protein
MVLQPRRTEMALTPASEPSVTPRINTATKINKKINSVFGAAWLEKLVKLSVRSGLFLSV